MSLADPFPIGTNAVSITAAAATCALAISDESRSGPWAGMTSFDPSAGFVSVGGWIDSPISAYPAVPALTEKAKAGDLETASFRGRVRMILIK